MAFSQLLFSPQGQCYTLGVVVSESEFSTQYGFHVTWLISMCMSLYMFARYVLI